MKYDIMLLIMSMLCLTYLYMVSLAVEWVEE